ncbi:phenylalanine-tRNA ligase, alpha subunit [Pneumocystis carinii B80]|uniref:phenylalanine--tRNA ligase n=1 Tax=Pneumocystis carinii (strain B80) TaxID=1408658 RepID=A0A0W4ZCG3_PNEC8|nr:phenylalanine-tRNA ligase, alpha subunit [Pneumocystis carinii B80]KTW26112.1 phenylalanine-tRNA ligase, alpha subunit [Pneumocystis carinii B80]
MEGLDRLKTMILNVLNTGDIEDTLMLRLNGEKEAIDQQKIQACLNSLMTREMVTYEIIEKECFFLTEEAKDIVLNGSYEARIFNLICSSINGLTLKELQSKIGPSVEHGLKQVFKNKWVRKIGDNLVKNVDFIVDEVAHNLKIIQENGTHSDSNVIIELRKRKLLGKNKQISFSVKKGPKFSLSIKEQITDLTVAILQSKLYESMEFKPYNFDAKGSNIPSGSLHPLLKMREEFRLIFLELGFEEMPTNKFVESCFWNFDSLFVPQQHPARDLQDTFYIKTPSLSKPIQEKQYVEAVRHVHEKGDFGSIGYRYPWSLEESRRLVLRTHTTSISAAMLYKLANQEGGFRPAKYFSIDRVFRNETVDSTHLAEFHQVEGVIADYNLTLGDLIGFMDIFYSKMGVKNLKFKPTYNPYTEPSLEIYSYHEGLKRWVEIGNSGLFRPEEILYKKIVYN